jgi:hypothetical protein
MAVAAMLVVGGENAMAMVKETATVAAEMEGRVAAGNCILF